MPQTTGYFWKHIANFSCIDQYVEEGWKKKMVPRRILGHWTDIFSPYASSRHFNIITSPVPPSASERRWSCLRYVMVPIQI